MESAVQASSLDQSFRLGFWLKKVKVLDQVNLNVPLHSIFGFVGANGAGKTTLIHLMVGLRQPSAGKIQIFGYPAHSAQARKRIGYLPERPYFYSHLTGEALLKHYGTLSGLSRARLHDRIPQILSQVGMLDARKVELRRYSKGMLQRIGVAQTLIHDPEFLILDEPMSGLDPFGRKEIRELISTLARQGRTIFFSTHVIPDVEAICDHVALIDRGKILEAGPITKFLEHSSTAREIHFSGLSIPEGPEHSQSSKINDPLGLPSEWPELKALRRIPQGWSAIVADQQVLNQVLQKLLEKGAQVHEVRPVRGSLEDFFSRGRSHGNPN